LQFRPHIEGLRALAILPILIFHLDTAWCPGGFIGVDVFFVISGYLITGMILAQGEAFDFRAFYLRRLFRLFPALLVTVIGTLIAGWYVLAPSSYVQLAWSSLASLTAVANIHFLFSVDYFNASSLSHPLLHVWSLSVEEQFYLVWPALLVVAGWRRIRPAIVIVTAAVLSFGAVLVLQPAFPEAVFYLMPFRIFELCLGAGLVLVEPWWRSLSARVHAAASALGLAALAGSAALLDGATTPWPGPAALPCLAGTALLILSGGRGFGGAVLGLGSVRLIGRISYSVYLVHWPLIALYRTYAITEPSRAELIALGVGSLVLGAVLYAAVEVPFRTWSRGGKRGGGETASRRPPALELLACRLPPIARSGLVALATSCALGGSIAIVAREGFASRLDSGRVQRLDKGLTFAGDICSYRRSRCAFGDLEASRTVHLVGDSLALNWVHGLDVMARGSGTRVVALYDHGCLFAYGTRRFTNGVPDVKCGRNVAEAYDYIARNTGPVILANDWSGYRNAIGLVDASVPLRLESQEYIAWLEERLVAGLAHIGASGRTVVLVKQPYTTGVDLAQCLNQPGSSEADRALRCRAQPRSEAIEAARDLDAMIDRVAARFPSMILIDPKPVFCPREACVVEGPDGLFFRDVMHLTNAGSRFLVDALRPQLTPVLTGTARR
jgi:peptidoglycan/LPS O-acetylase OafA/YrhL